jgi:hypothetical protein
MLLKSASNPYLSDIIYQNDGQEKYMKSTVENLANLIGSIQEWINPNTQKLLEESYECWNQFLYMVNVLSEDLLPDACCSIEIYKKWSLAFLA